MPIYAYRCETCGHAKDVLQKMSDPVLVTCPVCGADTFRKQLTSAGFQLKGSGWYVTDFRGGDTGKKPAADNDEGGAAKAAEGDGAPKDSVDKDVQKDKSGGDAATPAAAPAAGSGDSKPAAAPAPVAPAPSTPPAKP